LQLLLTSESLQLAAINGSFGRTEAFAAKPENVFWKLSLSRAELAGYSDNDPEAPHYRPGNVSEYKNLRRDDMTLWFLRMYDLDAAGTYLT
jgi:hypothetical protein